MAERSIGIIPERIERIILKPTRTKAEEEELKLWREEGMEKDDVYVDYQDLMQQRERAASGKKKG